MASADWTPEQGCFTPFEPARAVYYPDRLNANNPHFIQPPHDWFIKQTSPPLTDQFQTLCPKSANEREKRIYNRHRQKVKYSVFRSKEVFFLYMKLWHEFFDISTIKSAVHMVLMRYVLLYCTYQDILE